MQYLSAHTQTDEVRVDVVDGVCRANDAECYSMQISLVIVNNFGYIRLMIGEMTIVARREERALMKAPNNRSYDAIEDP
jgi:hypothetical protein